MPQSTGSGCWLEGALIWIPLWGLSSLVRQVFLSGKFDDNLGTSHWQSSITHLDAQHNRRQAEEEGFKVRQDILRIFHVPRILEYHWYNSIFVYAYFLHLFNIIPLSLDSIPCNSATEYPYRRLSRTFQRKVDSRKKGVLCSMKANKVAANISPWHIGNLCKSYIQYS